MICSYFLFRILKNSLPQIFLLLQAEPQDVHLHPAVAGHLSVSGISGEHLQAVKIIIFKID